jgi:hypothetical protein
LLDFSSGIFFWKLRLNEYIWQRNQGNNIISFSHGKFHAASTREENLRLGRSLLYVYAGGREWKEKQRFVKFFQYRVQKTKEGILSKLQYCESYWILSKLSILSQILIFIDLLPVPCNTSDKREQNYKKITWSFDNYV